MIPGLEWMQWIGPTWRVLKWPLTILFYVSLIRSSLLLFLPILGLMALALVAWRVDTQREAQGKDDFWGRALFFRYGVLIDSISIPIAVKPEWDEAQTLHYTVSLRQRLVARVQPHLPAGKTHINECLTVVDRWTQRQKDFLRVLSESPRGGRLAHFIHFAPYGNTVAVHFAILLRGWYSDWDLARFAFFSPFSIWVWGVPWLLNRHSICVSISQVPDDSFDALDLQTSHITSQDLIFSALRKLLTDDGFLTEALQQIITNYTIDQRVKISGKGHQISRFNQVENLPRPAAA